MPAMPSISRSSVSSFQAVAQHDLKVAAIVSAVVFATSMFGITTRSIGLLAAVWPTNACLLGMMVRWPHLATPAGWIGAVLGYLAADLLTGGGLLNTAILTAGNLTGVCVGYALFMRLDVAHRQLRHPASVLYFIAIVVAASASASLWGLIANPVVLGRDPLIGMVFWFAGEMVNSIAILPVLLTMPARALRRHDRRRPERVSIEQLARGAPAAALALSCLGALYIGGPGALAFPITALLWCALTYNLFTTAVLALMFSTWTLSAIKIGLLAGWPELDAQYALISIRLGVTLIALAPITVASVVAARNELLARFEYMAHHDVLTGLLNRRAFNERAEVKLSECASRGRPAAMLMMDIDHFKRINDTHGHGGGDLVLTSFASTASACLRDGDLIGRLGGEEFAVLMTDCTPDEAAVVAERIRASIAGSPIAVGNGVDVTPTVSIGLVHTDVGSWEASGLLSASDLALYRAKAGGRNRVERGKRLAVA